MRRRLSTLRALPPPSPPTAPSPALPVTPVPLLAVADSEPTDLLCGSTPHSSPAALPTAAPLPRVLAPPAARTPPSDSLPPHTQLVFRSPAAAPALLPPHSAAAHHSHAARPSLRALSVPAGNGPPAAPYSPARTSRGCTPASRPTRAHSPLTRVSSRTSPSHSPTPALASPLRPIQSPAAARSATPASPETAACNSDLVPAVIAPPASRTALPDAHKLRGIPHALAAAIPALATHRQLPCAARGYSRRTRSILPLRTASDSPPDCQLLHPTAGCSAPAATATPPATS